MTLRIRVMHKNMHMSYLAAITVNIRLAHVLTHMHACIASQPWSWAYTLLTHTRTSTYMHRNNHEGTTYSRTRAYMHSFVSTYACFMHTDIRSFMHRPADHTPYSCTHTLTNASPCRNDSDSISLYHTHTYRHACKIYSHIHHLESVIVRIHSICA